MNNPLLTKFINKNKRGEIPPFRPGDTIRVAPPVLHAVADAFRLEDYTQVDHGGEILWKPEGVQHLTHHQGISAGILLVKLHDV